MIIALRQSKLEVWLVILLASLQWVVSLASTNQATTGTVDAPAKQGPAGPLKVYVYNLPEHFMSPAVGPHGFGDLLARRLLGSPYYTKDGDNADYYWIPTPGMFENRSTLPILLSYIQMQYPWWNRTRDAGQARHVIALTGDIAALDAYGKPMSKDSGFSPDFNPVSPSRIIIHIQWNGYRDGADANQTECLVCFQQGKDIMMPTAQNVCGPLCGYSLEKLRQHSLWAQQASALQQAIERPRKHLLFYGGLISNPDPLDYTGRGGVYRYYANDSRCLIVRKGEHKYVDFTKAMLDSEFCYSPLGQAGGDTDRYVAASLFGCIPVLLNSTAPGGIHIPQALPLEEVLPWHEFGTVVDMTRLAQLGEQLECLRPRLAAMRGALSRSWHRLLYSSLYQSYLGEHGNEDAFEGIMQVLASRVPHSYKPSPEMWRRLRRGPDYFPCRSESPPPPSPPPSPPWSVHSFLQAKRDELAQRQPRQQRRRG